MDALTLLQEHIDVNKLLSHYDFDKVRPDGNYLRSCCKIHGGNNPSAFVMNAESGLWYCHTGGCGGGDIYTLVQLMEEIDFFSAVRWVANFFHVDINDLHIAERKEAHMKELKMWVQAMKSRKKKTLTEYIIEGQVQDVTKFRAFQESTLHHFQLGYVSEVLLEKRDGTSYTLYNRLVFPIFKDGIQVGASFRRIKPSDVPKWSHQPANIETKELLYNYDVAKGSQEIVVVEGIPDVWAYYEIGVHAVCTFGAHLTDEQYKMLMRTGADITLSYDGDESGKMATQKAIDMLRYKVNLRVVQLEQGQDPENLPRDELKLKYESRKRV